MKKQILSFFITMSLLVASPALAATFSFTYGGPFTGGNGTPTAYSNANSAFTAFSNQFTDLKTETFEGYTPNQVIQSMNVQDTYSGTQFGTIYTPGTSGYIGDMSTIQTGTGEFPLNNQGNYFSNGSPNDYGNKGGFTLNLNVGHKALGFYAMDLHDLNYKTHGPVILTVGETDTNGAWTWSETINLWDMTGSMGSGALVYFAFNSDVAFDTVHFSASGGDGYAIDNLSVGAATPIPGAVWLFGSGLLGLAGLRRRFA